MKVLEVSKITFTTPYPDLMGAGTGRHNNTRISPEKSLNRLFVISYMVYLQE